MNGKFPCGHPETPENTMIRRRIHCKDSTECRECRRRNLARSKAKKRTASG